jgi:hypothetical protein
LASILGTLASGNPDLAKASGALGAGAGAAGLAGTGIAAGEAAASGVAPGIATGLGAVAAPLAILSLLDQVMKLGGGEGTGINIADIFTGGAKDPWLTFGKGLQNSLGNEGASAGELSSALPYVQSQDQLKQILDLYKGQVGQSVGGYGAGSDPFTVPGLPGAGGSSHEWGQVANFDNLTNDLNTAIGALKGFLPESGGGPADVLWNTLRTNQYRNQQRAQGFNQDVLQYLSPDQQAEMQAAFPGPIDLGQPSSYWNDLISQVMQAGMQQPDIAAIAAPQGAAAPAPAPAAPAQATMIPPTVSAGAGGPDVYYDFLASQQ